MTGTIAEVWCVLTREIAWIKNGCRFFVPAVLRFAVIFVSPASQWSTGVRLSPRDAWILRPAYCNTSGRSIFAILSFRYFLTL